MSEPIILENSGTKVYFKESIPLDVMERVTKDKAAVGYQKNKEEYVSGSIFEFKKYARFFTDKVEDGGGIEIKPDKLDLYIANLDSRDAYLFLNMIQLMVWEMTNDVRENKEFMARVETLAKKAEGLQS